MDYSSTEEYSRDKFREPDMESSPADLLTLPVEVRTHIYSYLLPFVGRGWWGSKQMWWQSSDRNIDNEYRTYK